MAPDVEPALEQFLGTGHGLSPITVTRVTVPWQGEARPFNQRPLAGTNYVYVWVDGIHLKVRLEQNNVCLLVMIGVRANGTNELIALAGGFLESAKSWGRPATRLSASRQGRPRAPGRRSLPLDYLSA